MTSRPDKPADSPGNNSARNVAVNCPAQDADPFVVGYSSGGFFAHATTWRVEDLGFRPAGLVLLDIRPADIEAVEDVAGPMLDGLFEREGGSAR